VALKTTCIKNVKLMIVKIKTGCQNMEYLASQNFRLGCVLDIAALEASRIVLQLRMFHTAFLFHCCFPF